jgi:hypothetical protein
MVTNRTLLLPSALVLFVALAGSFAQAQTPQTYAVITNDDQETVNSVSAYVLAHNGQVCTLAPCLASVKGSPFLTQNGQGTNGAGVAASRVVTYGFAGRSHFCVLVANAESSSISAFRSGYSPKLQFQDNYQHKGDSAKSGAMALYLSSGDFPDLYASYSESKTVAFWATDRCKLRGSRSFSAVGLHGGAVSGMVLANIAPYLIVAYADGSIGSYSLENFELVSQEDTTGFACGGLATSVGMSNDQYAIFGDTTSGTTEIETAYVSTNGILSPTQDYGGSCHPGQLGNGLGSSIITLDPAAKHIYVANTGGGSVDTEHYSSGGVVTWAHCPLNTLRGFGVQWDMPGQLVLAPKGSTSEGDGIFLAEAGGGLSQGSYIGFLKANSETGCMLEEPSSPTSDPNSPNLLSIAAQPLYKQQ